MNTTNILKMAADAHYPTADTAQMDGAARELSRLSAIADALVIRTDYLPHLNKQFKRLRDNVYTTRSALGASALKMTQALRYNVEDLKAYAEELLEDNLHEQDKAEIIADGLKIRSSVVKLVNAEDASLHQLLRSIDENFSRPTTEHLITGLTADIERSNADIKRLQAEHVVLEEQRKVLNDGITLLQSKGYADMGKDVIVDVEKMIAGGGIPIPEIELIKMALEQAKKIMENIERDLTYFAMLNARARLVDKINANKRQQVAKQDDNVTSGHRIEFLTTILSMDDQRRRFLSEARNVTQATRFFLNTVTSGSASDEEQVAVLIEQIVPFNNYMHAIAYSPAR
jgi:hypothetical protein